MNLRIFPGTENIDFGKDRPHIGNTDSTDLSSGNLYLAHIFFFSTGLGEGILGFDKDLVRGDTGGAGVIGKIEVAATSPVVSSVGILSALSIDNLWIRLNSHKAVNLKNKVLVSRESFSCIAL